MEAAAAATAKTASGLGGSGSTNNRSNNSGSGSGIFEGGYYSGNGVRMVRLEGNYPIVEVAHQAASDNASASAGFRPGLCYYRGLFFRYHKLVLDPDIPPTLLESYQEIINETIRQTKLLATVATTPLTTRTSDVIERLTGLLLQAGLLTFQQLHEIITAGSFYPPDPLTTPEGAAFAGSAGADKVPFKPRPELSASVAQLLTIEALSLEQRVAQLSRLSERDWSLYLMISKARNRALLNVLIENPGLVGDARVRYAYLVRLQFTQPSYLMTAYSYRGIQLEKQAWNELETEVTF